MRGSLTAAAATLAIATALTVPPTVGAAAPAEQDRPQLIRERGPGNGAERNQVAAGVGAAQHPLRAKAKGNNARLGDQAGYPRQTRLRVYPVNGSDAAIKPGPLSWP